MKTVNHAIIRNHHSKLFTIAIDSVDFDLSTINLTEDQRNNISDDDIPSLYDKAAEVITLRSQIDSLLDESSKNVSVIAEKEKNLKELLSRIK